MKCYSDESFLETQRWCCLRAKEGDPAGSLRTPALAPFLFAADAVMRVDAVIAARRRALLSESNRPAAIGGRTVAFFPKLTTSDYSGAHASRGLLDRHNVPPWDTWLSFTRNFPAKEPMFRDALMCWMPSVFVPLVARAIAEIPEECLRWIDES
jgi:hypothetical protein